MKSKSYVVVTHRSGKRRIYSQKAYALLSALKIGAMVAVAIVVMLMFCGMAAVGNHPAKALQIVMIIGICVPMAAGTIWLCCGDKKK